MQAAFSFLVALLAVMGLMAPHSHAAPGEAIDPAPGIYYDPTTHTAIWIKYTANDEGYEAWVCPEQPYAPAASTDRLGWFFCPTVEFTLKSEGRQHSQHFAFTHAASGMQFLLERHWQTMEPEYYILRIHKGASPAGRPGNGAIRIAAEVRLSLDQVNAEYRQMVTQYGHGNLPAYDEHPDNSTAEKPVLYLYPTVPTDITVTLNVPDATQLVTYPTPVNGQWNVTAQPNGSLTQRSTGTQYPSLFWEAPLAILGQFEKLSGGWLVARDTLLPFLEARLNDMNFSAQERSEFIQYWMPRMMAHSRVFVHFAFVGHHAASGPYSNATGERYNTLAPLQISPAPTEAMRVMMLWHPVGNGGSPETTPQQLPRLNRTGYHSLEWGGQEVPNAHRFFDNCG